MFPSHDNWQVLIRRWHTHYLVPDLHPFPARMRGRVDDVVQNRLPNALAAQLGCAFDQRSDELIFVRRLELDFPVDAGWDADAIAAQCAQVLSWRLACELSIDDAGNVIRFANRIEYLARFLADRASGDAGSRWYYARFAGLNVLPCGAALRTALLEDIDLGLSALRTLSADELTCVIAAAGDIECRRIVDALGASLPEGDFAQAYAALVPVAQAPAPGGMVSASQLALWWIVCAKISVDRCFVLAARTVAHIVLALRSGNMRTTTLLQAIADGNPKAVAELACNDVEMYLHLRSCPPALLRQLLATEKIREPEPKSLRSTPFGAPFVLLDDLFALPLEQTTSGWPMLHSVPAATVMQFLVLARCCGAAHAREMFSDMLWRRLFGIAPAISHADIAAWLTTLGPRCRHCYARMLLRSDADVGHAHDAIAQCANGQHFRVVVDENGVWHEFNHAHSDAAADNATEATALGSDIDHLIAAEDALPHAWALLVALTAQRVVRRFLRRLPGFSTSHLAYAQRNLLEFPASVDAEDERIVVLLGRPPLDLILNITGCNRGARHWASLDARPFTLFNGG